MLIAANILYQGIMEDKPTNVKEFEELARRNLPKMYYDFFRGGAEDEYTLRENVMAFQRIKIQPRVLVGASSVDMSASLLGYHLSAPILVAPTSGHKLAHIEGEVATARGAAACNTIMVQSFSSSYSLEEVASSCNAIRFFQLYVFKRRDISAKLVQRAESSGFKAIVVTVDTPRLGRRESDIKNKMIAVQSANLDGLLSVEIDENKGGSKLEEFASQTLDPSLTWKDIGWIKSITKLPILVKGILNGEDARQAIEIGASGIIVSNHGGRQLDYAPATISVLEEVVQAVSGAVHVLVDGGVRRGTDVFKAVALGAKAVMVGRPIIYGLAAKGEQGVIEVIQMLKNELELTMALAGCPSVKDITRNHVRTPEDRIRSLM